MKILRYLIRLVPGLLFVFSGFVKAVDPLGSAYKFSDYFSAFHLGFLEPVSLVLAFCLSSLELVIGVSLIIGYCRRLTAWALLVFMSFFTVLTFVLALTNPVSDCGCFGDAVILSNWETFFKNIILLPFVIFLFIDRKRETGNVFFIHQAYGVATVFLLTVLFSWYSYRHLPVIDFRPFSVGTSIPESMELPPDAPVDQYETRLFYRNVASGKVEEFTLENYPRDTTEWKFDDAVSVLISSGYEPPIHDFAILDANGTSLTESILESPDPVLLMISYNLDGARKEDVQKADAWADLAAFAGDLSFYAITASTAQLVDELRNDAGIDLEFCAADEIMLKTVIRSNPGFVLIRNGIIEGKWAGRDFPAVGEVNPSWPEELSRINDELTRFYAGESDSENIFPEMAPAPIEAGASLYGKLLTMREGTGNATVLIMAGLCLILLIMLSVFNRKKPDSLISKGS
ncbi:MAG: BT_3928 family protein [Bacteroidota bacterium]